MFGCSMWSLVHGKYHSCFFLQRRPNAKDDNKMTAFTNKIMLFISSYKDSRMKKILFKFFLKKSKKYLRQKIPSSYCEVAHIVSKRKNFLSDIKKLLGGRARGELVCVPPQGCTHR